VSDLAKGQLTGFAADLAHGRALAPGEFRRLLDTLTREGSDAQKGAFLGLIHAHESDRLAAVPVIAEAARFLRDHPDMVAVAAPEGAIDIVGTGGDGQSSFNVSTAAAFVAAGAGAKVAKHGNRAVSSRSGASDVLAALGVRLDVPRATIERAIAEAGVGFLWAPQHHPAMKAWAPVRAELGFRTLFNLLGPLCNPARVRRQVIGVYAREWVRPVAEVMKRLGSEHVWVVHGADGLDELTTTGPSFVAELTGGTIREFEVTPEDAGLPTFSRIGFSGAGPEHNAEAMRRLFSTRSDALEPLRNIVLMNAAAGLVVAARAPDLEAGVHQAAHAIESGAALAALDKLVAITNALGRPASA
jgi:anthranilate phosphoribosyltransferase